MYVDQVRRFALQDGTAGTQQTLAEMARCVRRSAQNFRVRDKALAIVGACGGHDFRCEIDALFSYCRDNVTYRRDPVEQERVQDAERTLFIFGTGDCDDKVVCLATLLATLGHKSRFKVIGNRRRFSHVYLEVFTKDRGWVALDPTPEQAPAGWEARASHAATFDIFPASSSGNPLLFLGFAALAYYFFLR